MNNNTYLTIGKLFFGIAMLAIGLIHVVTKNFPTGLLYVPDTLPGDIYLAYISGTVLIISGVLILVQKDAFMGACVAAFMWLMFLLVLHLPKLIMTFNQVDEWIHTFEVLMLFAGALILAGSVSTEDNKKYKLVPIGTYIFALALLVFGVLHSMYINFFIVLMPAWMPWKLFWAYVIAVAFFASGISIIIQKMVQLSASMLGLMFFIWFCILHLPQVVANVHTETVWTSMFVVLASSGIALLIAGSHVKSLNTGN